MPRRGDAAVRDAGHAELARDAGDVVDRCGLCTPHRAHLLGGADGAAAHAHAQAVHACPDQVVRLAGGDDVAPDELDLRVVRLDVLDHVDLVHGVALGRVDDDYVHAGIHQGLAAYAVIRARTDSGGHQQLLVGILGCVGELTTLLYV